MQICETWECVNSFANWISAIGTVLISGIALWLTVRDRFLRMSNRFSWGIIASPNSENMKVFILSFTNIGARPVTVTNYKWRIPFSGKITTYIITMPQLDRRVAPYCTKMPVELSDGNGGSIYHTDDFFIKMDDPDNFLYPKNKLLAFIRIKFFKIYISTSLGKDIPVSVDRGVRKMLWDEYIHNKSNHTDAA
jgi:hypothetical protein